MKTILNAEIVQKELSRIRSVNEDTEGRNVEYDITLLKKILIEINKLVNNTEKVVVINSDMWHECTISLNKIVEYYGLRYGEVDHEKMTFTVTN